MERVSREEEPTLKTDGEMSPGTLLAVTLVVSALPLVAVEMFPGLRFEIAPAPYLLFHNIAELFSVMVSLSMFGMGWYTYDQSKNRHALFLSTAFLGIGLIDFMHTLANAAMPPFITANSSNKSTQFWIAVRLFQAAAFLASAYVYPERSGRWLSKRVLMTSALLVSFLAFAGIIFFPAYLPATYVPGTGLTPFKKISEYLIIAILSAAVLAYWRRLERTGERALIYFAAAFVICIFSELTLALYSKVFDTYNVLGHIYKVAAFYLIYHGIYKASVRAPYLRLTEVGEKLKEEVAGKERTEEALRRAYNDLDLRVRERTAELAQSNAQLMTEIEDRRKAEEELKENQSRLETVFAAIPNVMLEYDTGGRPLRANEAALKALGLNTLDFTRDQAAAKLEFRNINGSDINFADLPTSRALRGESVVADLYSIRTADGIERAISAYAVPLFKGDEKVTGVISLWHDITELKRAEGELQKAHDDLASLVEERTRELQEKEVLLKEIHHRVKNNLQVISSLVSLQADGSRDGTVRAVLRDVTDRVRSMALVHEKLYQSKDLASIDFAEYTRGLLGYLWRAHGAASAPVRLDLDLSPVSLPVDTAVPLGLVLNELAGNALKHAFRGRTEGEVAVSLENGGDGRIRLSVSDNGVGLPEGLDWRGANTLGLRLVQMLSAQIGAEVKVSGGEGTRFEISFGL